MSALQLAYWIASFIILAEAMNKLERTAPCAPGLSTRERWVQGLKALAWALLAFGSAGVVVVPFLTWFGLVMDDDLSLLVRQIDSTVIALGFAVLIIRTRVKEG